MREKKNSPSAATLELIETEKAAGKASISYSYLSTAPGGCQGIAALLTPGKENGVNCADLAEIVGTDGRTLRRRIKAEREAGALILSSPAQGYYLPASVEELRVFVRSMRHRAKEINAVTRAAEDALNEASGQLTIPGW